MKTLKQLHEEQDNIPKVHAEVEKELKKIPGVVAVDIGFKKVEGKNIETICFIVYVEEKKKEIDLSKEHIIPKEIHGVKTDVVVLPRSGFSNGTHPDSEKYRPLKGGIQIGNGISGTNGTSVGTIGCFAKLSSNNSIVGLSNHHVMFANGGHGPTGDNSGSKIGQPAFWVSCFCCDCDKIGTIINGVHDGIVDGAICTIESDIEKLNEIDGIGIVQGSVAPFNVGGIQTSIRVGDPVKKHGRTAGYTEGTVNSINYAMNKDGTLFTNQLHINPTTPPASFHDYGDSGSAILNASNNVVGLHMGGPYISGTTNFDGSSCSNKIHEVLNRLSITIPTGAFASGGGTSFATGRVSVEAATLMPSPEEFTTRHRLNQLESQLKKSELGKTILRLFYKHRTEVRDMINSSRPAMVAWNRNMGQEFLASIVKSVRNPEHNFKTKINGISIIALIDSMRKIFLEYGSIALREDIQKYSEALIIAFSTANNVQSIVNRIDSAE